MVEPNRVEFKLVCLKRPFLSCRVYETRLHNSRLTSSGVKLVFSTKTAIPIIFNGSQEILFFVRIGGYIVTRLPQYQQARVSHLKRIRTFKVSPLLEFPLKTVSNHPF